MFSDVGLSDLRLLAVLEGRKSDAILKRDLGPRKGGNESRRSSDGAPERDKGRGKPLPRRIPVILLGYWM